MVEFPGFEGLKYMQDMNSATCYHASIGETKQLIDVRDNKSYWVTKLKDGNCWMTQNLDLDIPASGLSANDTNIETDWNSNSTYKPEATQVTASPSFGTTNNNIKSWDPAQGGTEKYCNTSGCSLTASANNGHDAQGNYYSWGAATAGQAASISAAGESTQSICPKGWRLPLSGRSTENVLWNDNKSFAHLFESYGWTWNKGYYTDNLTGGTQYSILNSPFYFVYGGYVGSSSLNPAGSLGYYWSSTADSSTNAYFLRFETGVNPSGSNNRYYGFSVRCVAR